MKEKLIETGYEYAKEIYARQGTDVEKAMENTAQVAISLQCWQGDDVRGFDSSDELSGGISTTGDYPGRARNADELRDDLDKAMSLIPGKIKLNLHASYAEKNGAKIDRDTYTIEQFQSWLDWAMDKKIGLDFNPTYFSHPMMDGNFSLASNNEVKRRFWVEHGKRCREIAKQFGEKTGVPCVVNFWMPDGYKDQPADTLSPRLKMIQSLDEIFAEKIDEKYEIDTIESKLFGLGVESYTVASHEFSYGYALTNKKSYTLDAGHFHPTETISSKITSILCFVDKVMLHLSRGVRWDSDHVIAFDDELQSIMREIVKNELLDRTFIGTDFFDASINRIAAWAIGMRNAQKALLKAMLEPKEEAKLAEQNGDFTSRLAFIEEAKTMPFAAVWDMYCLKQGVPTGLDWLAEIKDYEKKVLSLR